MAANTAHLKLRIQVLEAELLAYQEAFLQVADIRTGLRGKVELIVSANGQSREQLVIENTQLRETIHWMLETSYLGPTARARIAVYLKAAS